MKKSFKKFFGILICTIFSVLTISSVSATTQLTSDQIQKLDEFYKDYQTIRKSDVEKNVEKINDWKKNLYKYLKKLNKSYRIKFFLELALKIRGENIVINLRPENHRIRYDGKVPRGLIACVPIDPSAAFCMIVI